MILSSLSKVTTSATQFGAHEWLIYLGGGGREVWGSAPTRGGGEGRTGRLLPLPLGRSHYPKPLPCSPGRAPRQRGVNDVLVVDAEHVDATVLGAEEGVSGCTDPPHPPPIPSEPPMSYWCPTCSS